MLVVLAVTFSSLVRLVTVGMGSLAGTALDSPSRLGALTRCRDLT